MNEKIDVPEAEKGEEASIRLPLSIVKTLTSMAERPPAPKLVDGWAGMCLQQDEAASNQSARKRILLERVGRDLYLSTDPCLSEEESASMVAAAIKLARETRRITEIDRGIMREFEERWIEEAMIAGVAAPCLEMNIKLAALRKKMDTDPAFARRVLEMDLKLGDEALGSPTPGVAAGTQSSGKGGADA